MISTPATHRRRPRVVIGVSSFPQPTEAFTLGKVRELLPRGWDLHIACTRLDDDAWRAVPGLMSDHDRATRVHVVDWSRESLLELAPDLVNIEYITLARKVLTKTQRLPVPTLVGIRGAETAVPPGDTTAYAPVWAHASALHLVARGMWREALARGCPPSMPHYVINAAVDIGYWSAGPRISSSPGDDPDRPLRLVCVTRLHWAKGVTWLLQAMRILLDTGVAVELDLVGDGDRDDQVRFTIADLGLAQVVRRLGRLDRQAVRAVLGEADIVVHPSLVEGFSNALIEGQAAGLPIVCTDAGDSRDVVEDGVTGVVVPRRSAAALANAIAELANDPERRRAFGAAGAARARERFDIAGQMSAIEAMYTDLLSRA